MGKTRQPFCPEHVACFVQHGGSLGPFPELAPSPSQGRGAQIVSPEQEELLRRIAELEGRLGEKHHLNQPPEPDFAVGSTT